MPPARSTSESQVLEEESQDEGSYQCTSCEEYIKTTFDAYLHPLLKCLMCRSCHTEYKTGDFSLFKDGVDKDGLDNYCRWCVDGGNLFACGNNDSTNKCHYVFCQDCIERNVPDDPVLKSGQVDEDFKWYCYGCDSSPLKELRRKAQEAILKLSQKDLKRTKENTPSSSQGQSSTQKVAGDKSTTNGGANRKDSETITPPGSPVVASKSKKGDDKATPSTNSSKGDKVDIDEASGSERKKRRTEAPAPPAAPEPDKRESLSRKEKDKKRDEEVTREPESYLKPALEKPKPPKTSLRNLQSKPSGLPSASRPSGPTPSSAAKGPTGPPQSSSATKQPPPAGNSITRSSMPVSKPSQPPSSTTRPAQPTPAQTQSTPSSAPSGAATTNAAAAPSRPKTTTNITTVENVDLIKTTAQTPKTTFASHQRLIPSSKGLKPNNEQIRSTTKVTLTEHDLKARLDNFGKVKDTCVKEINIKFQNILEMFTTKDLESKSIIKNEIEDLERPLQEFNTMLINLKSLYSSQC